MKRIKLTQGQFALVDNEDFAKVSGYKWYAVKHRNTFYALTSIRKGNKITSLKMHRLILGLRRCDGKITDHRDRNGLNNQKANLRLCTNQQNGQNKRPQKGGTSKYKGVYWHKPREKWCGKVATNGKNQHLGYFVGEAEAAKAYDKKAKELFGEFAYLNFPERGE